MSTVETGNHRLTDFFFIFFSFILFACPSQNFMVLVTIFEIVRSNNYLLFSVKKHASLSNYEQFFCDKRFTKMCKIKFFYIISEFTCGFFPSVAIIFI